MLVAKFYRSQAPEPSRPMIDGTAQCGADKVTKELAFSPKPLQ